MRVVAIQPICNERKVQTMPYSPGERGESLIEYALILILVAIVVLVILSLLKPEIEAFINNLNLQDLL
jgi:pilus assembly protein Flp/PilA